ncbi:MAG: hypothetical protein BGO69_12165 [Bacteroidetes bacterium 46-16]|nr:MAG: hypothetical protein BGO69_12165 [Bacteroidetes bacterium 46-16]
MLFAFPSKAQYIPNGSLEHWHQLNSPIFTYVPDSNWYTLDSQVAAIGLFLNASDTFNEQVYQTNYAHDGAIGAKLWSKHQGAPDTTFGIITACMSNCRDSIDFAAVLAGADPLDALYFVGGTPITAAQRPGSVGVWVKYYPNGSDTAHIMVNVLNSSGAVIGTADSMLTGVVNLFSFIEPHITYSSTDTSATLQVIITSSPLGVNAAKDSTIMYVDQISYTPLPPTGIAPNSHLQNNVECYPNPSTGIVYLHSNSSDKLSWQVYNTSGQVVVHKTLAAHNREDLSYLPAGTYFYNILNSRGAIVQQDKFTIIK